MSAILPDWNVTGKLCGAILSLFVEVKDQEDYGAWNHLLLSKPTEAVICEKMDKEHWAVSGEVHISWSQVPKPLPFKEGERFRARVTGDCTLGGGIDESITAYWAAYRVWTCDATSIEVIDE